MGRKERNYGGDFGERGRRELECIRCWKVGENMGL